MVCSNSRSQTGLVKLCGTTNKTKISREKVFVMKRTTGKQEGKGGPEYGVYVYKIVKNEERKALIFLRKAAVSRNKRRDCTLCSK